MNESLILASDWVGGLLIGALFYGGLWWTIYKGIPSKQPAFWFAGSLLLRTSVALGCFYFIARGHWERMLACLFGFFVARLVMTQFARATEKQVCPAREARNAP